MQVQFTIELRVDVQDKGKLEPLKTQVQMATRHLLANATLLSEAVKPQIACWSDDWFGSHEDIDVYGDIVQEGLDQIGPETKEDQISTELLEAFRDEGKAK